MIIRERKSIFEFGLFRLDVSEHLLLRGQQPIPLAPKLFELLLLLVQNNGHILQKDELMKEIWPDTFVGEGTLTRHISTLRMLLGDHRGKEQFIKTVPRLGYRFVAAVSMVPDETDDLLEEDQDKARNAEDEDQMLSPDKTYNSIAVLPLVNVSDDADAEYLSDGVTESIINSLSRLPELRVMARSTVFRYKGKEVDPQKIGHDLNVQAIVTGRIIQLGDNFIFRVELVDVADGSQLWGKEYKRQLSDIFKVQEELSMAISKKLRIKLRGEEKSYFTKHYTHDIEAYKLYMKGRYFWNKRTAEQVKKGIEYFEQAINRDPTYAMAYVGLADSYDIFESYSCSASKEAFPRAKAMALKALEIDDTLAEARTSLAYTMANYDWDWPGAEKEYKRAIELNRNYAISHHWYGQLLAKTEQYTQAIIELKCAQELDPLSLIINTDIGRVFYYLGWYDKAIEQCMELLEMDSNFCPARGLLARAFERKGMYKEAIAECKKLMMLSNGDAEVIAFLGNFYAVSGKSREALKMLDRLKKLLKQIYVSPFSMAIIHTGLGRKDQALEWLEKAYKERCSLITYLKVDPIFESLRSDPRFADLLKRVGLASRAGPSAQPPNYAIGRKAGCV